jgi:glycerol uptake facilitator-like aquaporin
MGSETGLMGHATRAFVRIVATVVVAYAIATAVRYGLVERDDLGSICQSAASPWWCDLRMLVIRGFLNDVFGRTSLVLAALAIWRRSALAATLAVAIGTFGMVLYSFTWSGIGMLGGALVLARLQGQWQQHAQSQQRAG